jgi:hypothetical protein
MMSGSLFREMRLLVACCCLLVLLAACDPFGSSASGPTPTLGTSDATATPTTGGATPSPTTVPMPATQTACPSAGTARAAVFSPLVLGSHQTIVYIFNQGTSPSSSTGEIKRYDASTDNKVIIVHSPKSSIGAAQISADGKWILFTTQISGEGALQLVRMDGQGLQTLYCSSTGQNLSYIQWSPNMQSVIFMDGIDISSDTIYLLDIGSGKLQPEVLPPSLGQIAGLPTAWLDNTHVYMSGFVADSGAPPQSLYLLDTSKGPNQHVTDVQKVFSYSGYCLSFDSSVDHTKLFVSTCHAIYVPGTPATQQGPSTIIAEPALGGSQMTVYTTPTLAITTVRVISRTTLLLLIQNLSGDTSHNGLWKMNLDGTGLTRLTTTGGLNVMSQSPWSNVSRDGSLYALDSGNRTTQSLLIGSLAGSSPSAFATFSGAGNLNIVGWTTM